MSSPASSPLTGSQVIVVPARRSLRRAPSLALATVVVSLAVACSNSTGIGSPSAPRSPAALDATATAVPSIASSAAEPSATPIGPPADDGARVIVVQTVSPRVRDLIIETPAAGTRAVRLLLPAAFDAQPTTRWPVLYLLHGAQGSHADWMRFTDVESLMADQDLLVVMPDAGDVGFYSDWWNGGQGGPPMWETFHMTELPQLLERGWRSSDRRAVAGLSMGGFGAMLYAARHPGMFKAAASFSGAVDPIGGELDIGDPNLWGDPVAQVDVWQAHDPVNLAEALKGTFLYVAYGDGGKGPLDASPVSSDDLEPWIADQNRTLVARLNKLKIPVKVDAYGPGSHDWPYWERALHRSLPLLLKALDQ